MIRRDPRLDPRTPMAGPWLLVTMESREGVVSGQPGAVDGMYGLFLEDEEGRRERPVFNNPWQCGCWLGGKLGVNRGERETGTSRLETRVSRAEGKEEEKKKWTLVYVEPAGREMKEFAFTIREVPVP